MTRFDLTQYPRLAELLDALCDRGLSDAEADELLESTTPRSPCVYMRCSHAGLQ